ncbi:hypothetical protein MMB17_14105 [Methylobacterium organophilum]|uniref:hypothetical protein n=1 Tax=Methylobacterium organophilum TaxID=410 RepID=UPI001F13065D|nr:hypothetical protein [Methylobacterium organophilum]UMY15872.1 hypothetical protein MMB17_14105 [Methylobacterium organophilum]
MSPYRTVARLVLPPEDGLAEAKRTFADDVLSLRPAHSLAAQRLPGSLMRARLKTYRALSRFRHAAQSGGRGRAPFREHVPA